MPAIITHHLFGEDAVRLLAADAFSTQEELLAFLLGNQGPDPLFSRFSALPQVRSRCYELASRMHAGNTVRCFASLHEALSNLPEGDRRVGRAWALGFVGHYALDSTAHPFIYAEQKALIEAGEGLEDAQSEVHAILESDIDVWMLSQLRGQTVADAPTTGNLARTELISRVAGALLAQVAMQVFDVPLAGGDYGASVADYERVYKVIDPRETTTLDALARMEGLARSRSYLRSLSHSIAVDENCPAANLDHHGWLDETSGQTRTDSFPDLYHLALERWERLAQAFEQGDWVALERECVGINMNGSLEA